MSIRLNGSTSGYTELDAQASPGNNVLKMPANNGSAYQVLRNGATAGTTEFADNIVSGTAVASTSGTSIDFTGIPSWVKRITVMLAGVSTNGTSPIQIQIGSGSIVTTGYSSILGNVVTAAGGTTTYTSGFICANNISAATTSKGSVIIANIASNSWVCQGILYSRADTAGMSAGDVTLSGTLDRVRITTVNGTDTFDAGTINILYE
jgi:hypothetical protein